MFNFFNRLKPAERFLGQIWPSREDQELIVGAISAASPQSAYPSPALEASMVVANLGMAISIFLWPTPNATAENTIRAAERRIFERLEEKTDYFAAGTVLLLRNECEIWERETGCAISTKSKLDTIFRYVLAPRLNEYQMDVRKGMIAHMNAPAKIGTSQLDFFSTRFMSHVSGIPVANSAEPFQEGLSDMIVAAYFNMLAATLLQSRDEFGL